MFRAPSGNVAGSVCQPYACVLTGKCRITHLLVLVQRPPHMQLHVSVFGGWGLFRDLE